MPPGHIVQRESFVSLLKMVEPGYPVWRTWNNRHVCGGGGENGWSSPLSSPSPLVHLPAKSAPLSTPLPYQEKEEGAGWLPLGRKVTRGGGEPCFERGCPPHQGGMSQLLLKTLASFHHLLLLTQSTPHSAILCPSPSPLWLSSISASLLLQLRWPHWWLNPDRAVGFSTFPAGNCRL